MSSIAEFYSRNLANEVVKGLTQKAKSGGTISRAPLGYLNKQGRDDQGREDRWVDVDPERGPLMALAFTEYEYNICVTVYDEAANSADYT